MSDSFRHPLVFALKSEQDSHKSVPQNNPVSVPQSQPLPVTSGSLGLANRKEAGEGDLSYESQKE